jgi:hypothetical protein
LPGQPGSQSSSFMLSDLDGMTGMYHHTQIFSVEMGVSL